jgi:hypothetical protein
MKYCVAPVKLASFATTQKILAAIREPFLKKCSWELTTTACCFGERLRSALVPYPDGLGIKEILSANFASTDSSDNIFDQDDLNLSLKMPKYLPSGKRPLCPQLGHKGHETRCKRNQWPLFWLQRSVFFWSTGATYLLHQHDWQSGHVCSVVLRRFSGQFQKIRLTAFRSQPGLRCQDTHGDVFDCRTPRCTRTDLLVPPAWYGSEHGSRVRV